MRLVSVFGPFGSRALVEMQADEAAAMVRMDEAPDSAHTIDAALRELEWIRARDERLADSAQAAVVVAMAYELENPYNSATAKANCARAMTEALEKLHAQVPSEEEDDELDSIRRERAARRAAAQA